MIKIRFLLLIAMLLWSSAFVGIRYTMQFFSPEGMALLRYLIASLCMGIIYFTLKNRPSRKLSEIIPSMLIGILGIGVYNLLLNYGEQHISASIASFINGLNPIIVAILSIWIYQEALTKRTRWGFIISLLGMCLIVLNEVGHPPQLIGTLLTIAAIICGAIYTVFQKKIVLKMSAIEFTSYVIWGGTLSLLFFMPNLLHDLQQVSLKPLLVVIYLGIFPGAIAYSLASYSFSQMPTAEAASFSYLIPFFSTCIAFIFLGEIPSALPFIGGVIALLGAVLVNKNLSFRFGK